MIRNSGEPETDTTDCSCMELYSRNSKYHQTARSSALRSHQSHSRLNTCTRCRKRKPGNPKNLQHCPSCLCPPDVVRSSSGRLRGSENMEEVLARFEEITKDPRETGVTQLSNGRPTVAHGKNGLSKSNPIKSNNISRQQRKIEHDQMLNALYHDLMSSGLATEETQGCRRYQPPIKSVRKKSNLRTERSSPLPGNQETVDLDSDTVLRYFRDYKNLKGPPSDTLLQKQENGVHQQRSDMRHKEVEGTSEMNDTKGDEQRRQFERDKRELNELSQEVRAFEVKKNREREESEEQREKCDQTLRQSAGDQDDHLKRKVSFLPSKLPVPMYGNQSNRSRSPPGDNGDKFESNDKAETKTGYHSTPIPHNIVDKEYDDENFPDLHYSKESNNSLAQDLKDIPYCHVPYRCVSAPTPHPTKTKEQSTTSIPEIHENREQCGGQSPLVGPSKKYAYAGGDLDLHASKSYIVDLIDRALSRELGTVPEERKVGATAPRPTQSEKEICVEIARVLQGDYCSTYTQNCTVQKEAPDYVKHLKVLRWDYLNHIQDELRKLQDLERILDTYSPRRSLLISQSQASSSEQKKNHQTVL